MSLKSFAAFAFVCLAPVAAFAETAPPIAPATKSAVTVAAPAPTSAPTSVPSPTTSSAAGVVTDQLGSKRWQVCAGDVQKFCSNIEKGKGVVRACLESHTAELTPACKTSMADHAAAHAAKAAEKAAATVKQ